SQRYGSIRTELRIGSDVHSPLILEGTLDLLIGMEPLETLRHAPYISERTTIVMSDHIIPPTIAYLARSRIPSLEEILDELRSLRPKRLEVVDAYGLAERAGDYIAANVVIIGAAQATGALPFSDEILRGTVEELSPPRYRDLNLRAYDLGREALSLPR
ncbi:MAG: 2-oxoacid:acceptor oxidoreductase family protein, partial [Candidatus Korarchaeum sp.]|nr:2-oxoacid:acceptor oxidoreductase family protein [Candidatus Korarchaeum sp.]